MITPREQRLLAIVQSLRERDSSAMVDMALDRLEAQIRTKDASGHEHVGKGSPQGGQFGSGGGGGATVAQHGRAKRKKRAKRKPGKKSVTASGGGKARDVRVKIAKRQVGPKDSARSERASQAYDAKRSNRDVQRYGERQEAELIKKMGGVQGSDNGAVDIVRRVGGETHGLEVKTLINKGGPNKSGAKAQIKMMPDQLARKEAWVNQAPNRRSGVIVMDHRDRATDEAGNHIGNKEAYSGHELYYRRDYGAHRIGGMYAVKSHAELKMLMSKSDDELRSLMASDKRYKGVIRADKK